MIAADYQRSRIPEEFTKLASVALQITKFDPAHEHHDKRYQISRDDKKQVIHQSLEMKIESIF
jgi:hypothetical protein